MRRVFSLFCLLLVLATLSLTPHSSHAGLATTFELPDTGYVSNVAVDIIVHNGAIWMATSEGLSYTLDSGKTWLLYDAGNGLPGSSISALHSIPTASGNRLWVGTNHDEFFSGTQVAVSDGLSYTDDNGDTWVTIDFDTIPYVTGGDRTIFDITGHYDPANLATAWDDNWMFFTAFAGGFLASRDGGMSWRRIFPSISDSAQFFSGDLPSLRNRYFSCAVDTSHGDSLFVWTGTAGGIFQYIFAEPKDKNFARFVNDIEITPDGVVLYGSDSCFTRGTFTGGPYFSRFEDQGLPGPSVTEVKFIGDVLYAGTAEYRSATSTGLIASTDTGRTFTPVVFPELLGANRRVSDFAEINGRLYMAAEQAGLWVSGDTGTSWTQIYVDSSDMTTANGWNTVNALNIWGDTLRVGTDSGLVQLFLDPSGLIDSSRFYQFPESDSSATRVIGVRTQEYIIDPDTFTIIWTINRPLTGSGTPMIGRSEDGGLTWLNLQVGIETYDINFANDTTYAMGEAGIRYSIDSDVIKNPTIIYDVIEYEGSVAIDSLADDTVTNMVILGDTLLFGTSNGFAMSHDRGATFDIVRSNHDTLKADAVLGYSSAVLGIPGDFIPALDVFYRPDETAWVIASARPAFGGTTGTTVGTIDTLITINPPDTLLVRIWRTVYGNYAWNYSFYQDSVIFAATNDGLLKSDIQTIFAGTWDTLTFKDSAGFDLLLPNTPVYASAVDGDYLWVGTDDRTMRLDLVTGEVVPYFVVDDETPPGEVYAFPVPYSHTEDQFVEFHFVVEADANITIEIYDFALNLVRRVIDNQFFAAGIYPSAGAGRPIWDGRNGKGDQVAVGMYHFKVKYSTGEVRWGKLAVIP